VNLEVDPVARYTFAALDAYRETEESAGATEAELEWAYEI
jgi:hypothetical protein